MERTFLLNWQIMGIWVVVELYVSTHENGAASETFGDIAGRAGSDFHITACYSAGTLTRKRRRRTRCPLFWLHEVVDLIYAPVSMSIIAWAVAIRA